MTPSPDRFPPRFRPLLSREIPELAAFVARLNQDPTTQCLHCASRPADVAAALADFPGGPETGFVVAEQGGGWVGALGVQAAPDGDHGWLWGPFVRWPEGNAAPTKGTPREEAAWEAVAGGAWDYWRQHLCPAGLRRVDGFLHEANRRGQRFLSRRGFRPRPPTHLYVATPTVAAPAAGVPPRPAAAARHGELSLRYEASFTRLHEETFPVHAWNVATAEELIAGVDADHRILVAPDRTGLRLLGYVCVSVNHAPREGYVDYLAVHPGARGRGVGAGLLRSALSWSFDERGLPQAALCVSDWRAKAGAHRLYERVGFRRQATGIGSRLELD